MELFSPWMKLYLEPQYTIQTEKLPQNICIVSSQDPGWGPSNVLTWSCVSVKFTKVRDF